MNEMQEPTTPNAFSLTGRQGMGIAVFGIAVYVLTPVAWDVR